MAHWISTESFTVMVKTDWNKIVFAAPLVRRFLGQPVGNLLNWSIPFKGLRHHSWPAADGTEPKKRHPQNGVP
jgi:hypothetical protein